MLHQDAGSQVTAQADGARHDDGFLTGNLLQVFAQLVEGQVAEARDAAQRILFRRAYIQLHAVRIRQELVAPGDGLHPSAQDVVSHEARHVHRVFSRGVGRGIGMFQFHQVVDGALTLDDLFQHLDALVHPAEAHDLCAQQTSVGRSEQNLQAHADCVRIVTGMRGAVCPGCDVGDVLPTEQLGVRSRRGNRQGEHLGDGRAQRACIGASVAQHEVVGDDASLLVGGTCQRNQCRFARDEVGHFDGIAQCVDGLIGSLHAGIDADASGRAQFQPSLTCQLGFRTYADAQYHQVGLQHLSVVEVHTDLSVLVGEVMHAVLQVEGDTLFRQVLMHDGSHGEVERSHDLVRHLHDVRLDVQVTQVFRHLQSDEASAHDDGMLHLGVFHQVLDGVRVGHVAQGQDARMVDALDARTQRFGTRGEYQSVVTLGVGLSRQYPPDVHPTLGTVDGDDLLLGADVDAEAVGESLCGLYEELLAVVDGSTYIIR